MSTGKDYGLPNEYADWVEQAGKTSPVGRDVRCIRAHYTVFDERGVPVLGANRYFVPPKPKLPDVGPGAVISYTDKLYGTRVRVMRGHLQWFSEHSTYTDKFLLDVVDSDGFTVELEGEGHQ